MAAFPSSHGNYLLHFSGLPKENRKKPRAIVIGAGWAGLASAHALQKAGAEVVLVEAGDSIGGLSSAVRTAKGRAVEPGIKGYGTSRGRSRLQMFFKTDTWQF